MSESEEDELDMFERQLKFEQEEKERRQKCSNIKHGSIRTDPDGTEYEWDADKMAYFPKIDANFIAQYQMNYGGNTETSEKQSTSTEASSAVTAPPSIAGNSGSDWSEYFTYVQKYISEHNDYPPDMTQVHKDYYVYYYNYYYGNKSGQKQEGASKKPTDTENKGQEGEKQPGTEGTEETAGESKKEDEVTKTETGDEENSEEKKETDEDKSYREYYEYYKEYYKKNQATGESGDKDSDFDQWVWYNYYYGHTNQEAAGEGEQDGKKQEEATKEEGDQKQAKKRKANEPQGWFEIDQTKNTNVYVSGLPDDVTDEEYEALMNKCGMITLDPRTRRLKLKLYRDSEGKPKGDGLCCYIKPESVELALQVLDEYDVRGHKISVERAKFEMKGTFDPKKRKKLSNREKKKIKQHQEKLLDWRPDKPKGYRAKHERVLVIKNAFNPADFEGNPAKIQMLREEVRAQCTNFGLVKKVIIYDRHSEGVVTVGFAEPEEADQGKESLHGRYFQGRQIRVETWDGKTKFEVKESEEERDARLKQWGEFLETGGQTAPAKKAEVKAAEAGKPPARDVSEKSSEVEGLSRSGQGASQASGAQATHRDTSDDMEGVEEPGQEESGKTPGSEGQSVTQEEEEEEEMKTDSNTAAGAQEALDVDNSQNITDATGHSSS